MGALWAVPTSSMSIMWTFSLVFLFSVISCTLSQPTVSQFGQCQAKCLSEFSTRHDRKLNNGVTILNEIDVTNNTQFSLCKLGCTHPGFDELGLPSFILGQKTIKLLQMKNDDVIPQTVVSRVIVLCADFFPSNNSLFSLVELQLENSTQDGYVHFMEAVYRSNDGSKSEQTMLQSYVYSTSVDIQMSLPSTLAAFQLRVTTFSSFGIMGNTVRSAWIGRQIIENSAKTEVSASVKSQVWLEEQAAVELQFSQSTTTLPVCSLILSYDISVDESKIAFKLDRSMGYLLDGLMFDHEYRVRIFPSVFLGKVTDANEEYGSETLIKTQQCRQLAKDGSMCAPPSVEKISWSWSGEETVLLNWTYGGDNDAENQLLYPRMVHFVVSIRAVSTPGQPQCQQIPEQKRSVTGTHRAMVAYITEQSCNYEVEMTVVDTRNRRSPPTKSMFIRYQPASSLIIGAAASDWVQLGMLGVMVAVVIVSAGAAGVVCLRSHRINRNQKDNGKRVMSHHVVVGTIQASGRQSSTNWSHSSATKQVVGRRGVYDSDEDSQRTGDSGKMVLQRPFSATVPRPPTSDPPKIHYLTTSKRGAQSLRRCERRWSGGPPTDSTSTSSDARMDKDGYSFCIDRANNTYDNLPDCDDLTPYVLESTPRISKDELSLVTCLGYGRFGVATLVNIRMDNRNAVLKQNLEGTESETHLSCISLKRELVASQAFYNRDSQESLVQLLAVVVDPLGMEKENIFGLLFEHCEGGDLRAVIDIYSRDMRNKAVVIQSSTSIYEEVFHCDETLLRNNISSFLLQCSFDIASALEYITETGFVHRDIACKNAFLVMHWTDPYHHPAGQRIKLGDFGLCEPIRVGTIENTETVALLPVDLLPPETFDQTFYAASGDVWEFGLLLAEIASLGIMPFLNTQIYDGRTERLKSFLKELSSGCTALDESLCHLLRPIIIHCLSLTPNKRPSISTVVHSLQKLAPPRVMRTESFFV